MIKAKALLTAKALWVNFEKKLPIRGAKSNLVKQRIKKHLINQNYQIFVPIIFVNNELYEKVKEKVKNAKIDKATEINFEIDLSDILTKNNFSILKEKLLKLYA